HGIVRRFHLIVRDDDTADAILTRLNSVNCRPFFVKQIRGDRHDDVEILRARQFVDSYYRTWGGRYVQFAIELKDDWLKGRSFQY
ncbi:hypothetical protein MJM59_28450, partial [Salmonella enterica subsp. enterica serovar Montevideo]|nr:hypothetical protein [Salmonella enterica subsp. enterica serovar Montevideo]